MSNHASFSNAKSGDTAAAAPPLFGSVPTLQAGGFTGSVELSFALDLPQARGLAPQLALVYASRAGNGPFGLGFGLGLPGFSVRTSVGVPEYLGDDPLEFASAGPLVRRTTTGPGDDEGVVYLPQFESDFTLMIQRPNADGTSSWKTVDRENRVSIYGTGTASRIADPRDATRTTEWLIEETSDSKGNWVRYRYKSDDQANLPNAVYESDRGPPAQRYIERISWGNYIDDDGTEQAAFELVFDYGEYALDTLDQPGSNPYQPVRAWATRPDACSSFRPGFELRTQRLCRNILLFHRFKELGDQPALTRSWALEHTPSPVFTTLAGLRETGWRRRSDDGTYEQLSQPSVKLDYTRFDPPAAPTYRVLQVDTLGAQFPGTVGSPALQAIDLDGVGLPGLLNSEGPTLYYHRPLGDGRYAAPLPLDDLPDLGMPQAPSLELADLNGDGRYALVASTDTLHGYFQREDHRWLPYRPFPNRPTATPGVASMEVALSGTGRSDALMLGSARATVFEGRGTEGWGEPHGTALPDGFPIASEGGESEVLTFADPFGDGLSHRVRIRDGSFEVWPSLGHGRFGERIVLANAPRFDSRTQATRIFLANLSGGAGVDLVIARDDCIEIHVNESGNGFSAPRRIALPGQLSDTAQLNFSDILGNGSVCIVFTQMHPQTAHFYFPLDGQAPAGITANATPRPWMLLRWDTQRGTETVLGYASSTRYALAAQRAGQAWLTQMPFPVEVVANVCVTDHINQVRSWQEFDYANGYYDPVWREFRGFGHVTRLDREESLAGFPSLASTSQALTRSWYLAGDPRQDQALLEQARSQYFPDPHGFVLEPVMLQPDISKAGADTVDQAWRAMAGHLIHEELYANGGSQAVPLTVSSNAWSARLEQSADADRPASIYVHPHESLNLSYDEVADDPSTQHHFVLEVNAYGDIVRSSSINYPRRATLDPDRIVYPEQTVVRGIVELSDLSTVTMPFRLLGAEFEIQGLQLGGLTLPPAGHFDWAGMRALVESALLQRIAYGEPFDPARQQTRPYSWRRTYYWNDAQDAALPLGEISARALAHHREDAAFSDYWLTEVFGTKVDAPLLRDEGGYVAATTGYWWNPGLVTDYALPAKPESFFMPWRTRYEAPAGSQPVDGLLSETVFGHDKPYHLFIIGKRERIADTVWLDSWVQPNYQSLLPALAIDANGNHQQYLYDPLARVLATSIFKPADASGPRVGDGNLDDPADFQRRPGATFADVLEHKAYYLQQSTSFCMYHGRAYAEHGQPCSRITLTRQTHVSDLGSDPNNGKSTLILAQVDYEDAQEGSVQSRREADHDPITGLPLWLVEGSKRFNASSLEVEQFYAWLSDSPLYTPGDTAIGGSPVPPTRHAYDPLQRLLRSDDPKGFFSRSRYTPWETLSYDRDDTVRDSVYYQAFMRDYPGDPTTAQRDEWEALTQAADFYNTPRTDVFDNAGSQIRVLQNNLGNVPPDAFEAIVQGSGVTSQALWNELHRQGYLVTRNDSPTGTWITGRFRPYFPGFMLHLGPEFAPFAAAVTAQLKPNGLTTFLRTDAQQRRLLAIDPRLYYDNVTNGTDHANFRYMYAMQSSTPARSISVDAGTRWTLENIFGSPMRRWDALRATLESYDRLQRVLRVDIDDGTSARLRTEQITWGETAANAARHNLCGRIHEYRDETGLLVHTDYSLQGQLTAGSKQLPLDYRVTPNWNQPVELEATVYRIESRFDVQKRTIAQVFPNGSATRLRYDLTGRMRQSQLRGSDGAWLEVTTDIVWNPSSQIERIAFGGGIDQERGYEATTRRLLTWTSSAPPPQGSGNRRGLQNIGYVYDPVGNLTLVRDRCASLLFCYPQPEAVKRYRYDAIYELCGSTGIEHPGITANTHVAGFKQSIFAPLCPANPEQQVRLRGYEERYVYDDARNLISLTHLVSSNGGTDFERRQPVQPDSNRLAGQSYDCNGNPLQLLLGTEVSLGWNARNLMAQAGPYDKTAPRTRREWYSYDHTGNRVRRVIEEHDAEGTMVRVLQQIFLGPGFQVDLMQDVASGGALTLRSTRTRLANAQQMLAILDERIDGATTTSQLRLQLAAAQNSISVEADPGGTPLSYEAYYPFGGTSVVAGPDEATVDPKHIRYSGKIADDGLGLYDYGARYFAPWLGRWLNPDPSGTINGLNLFQFVRDDPTTLADSDGRQIIVWRVPGRNGNLPTLRIRMTGVLVSNVPGGTFTPLQVRRFARRLERQIARSYSRNGTMAGDTVRVVTSARIRASNHIYPNDHVFRLVPLGRLPSFQQGVGPRYMPGQYRPGGGRRLRTWSQYCRRPSREATRNLHPPEHREHLARSGRPACGHGPQRGRRRVVRTHGRARVRTHARPEPSAHWRSTWQSDESDEPTQCRPAYHRSASTHRGG
ncbi:SpvB/TcaC N-terminal domain-containing protein [Paracidovorax cattleyae]|uniref:SpvB/TcaC N-terminal domain-containing protein n=1 Tax=Paracidovorax cattleyae TaxID=80868 RepID=UPI0018AFF674|nr:SpvB/TcaC N-terminal domain-containing protein [Paracidovorax cattleyae]MBF9264058.1 hypothetical protein [Paracidovorax cattleyae]